MIDRFGGETAGLENKHALVHQGKLVSGLIEKASLADTGTFDIHLKAGTKTLHLTDLIISVTGTAKISIITGATVTGVPSGAFTPVNRNLIAPQAVGVVVKFGTATYTGGTLTDLSKIFVASGNPQTVNQNRVAGDIEWLAGAGADVIFRVTNQSGGAINIAAELFYYER
jgi:hypothetical protein